MDLITYVKDIEALKAEAVALQADEESVIARYFTIDDDNITFDVSKVPVHRTTDSESICLVRGIARSVLQQSTSIKILGECIANEYVFDSDEDEATYYRVLGPLEVTYTDENGIEQTYTKPKKLGVFA